MDIGEITRTIIVEPIESPVPEREPSRPEPKREPVKVPEREKVPA